MDEQYFIGVLSGTSMDALDAVLISIADNKIKVIGHCDHPYPNELRTSLRALCESGENEIERMAALDNHLAELAGHCINRLLSQTGLRSDAIGAIGSHGQTIRHLPSSPFHNTLQIGNPNLISELTGITTVADFRRADMASGGQGAPLVPAFHHAVFSSETADRAIINIGGIANITLLPMNEDIDGYDIGPGNTLMDLWCQQHLNSAFDEDGQWAKSGSLIPHLLKTFLDDPYIRQAAPKSTGIEYFNQCWLTKSLGDKEYEPADVQRTLAELTSSAIVNSIVSSTPANISEVFICGGGAKNRFILERLRNSLPDIDVMTTEALGIDPQHVEASAFAWLAYRTINSLPGNIPNVTGAKKQKILGGIYPA